MLAPLVSLLVALLLLPGAADAADYAGPLIDAHSHVPGAKAIDAYVAAMKRHNVSKVVLLGELPPAVAERVAWKNAATLYRLD